MNCKRQHRLIKMYEESQKKHDVFVEKVNIKMQDLQQQINELQKENDLYCQELKKKEENERETQKIINEMHEESGKYKQDLEDLNEGLKIQNTQLRQRIVELSKQNGQNDGNSNNFCAINHNLNQDTSNNNLNNNSSNNFIDNSTNYGIAPNTRDTIDEFENDQQQEDGNDLEMDEFDDLGDDHEDINEDDDDEEDFDDSNVDLQMFEKLQRDMKRREDDMDSILL